MTEALTQSLNKEHKVLCDGHSFEREKIYKRLEDDCFIVPQYMIDYVHNDGVKTPSLAGARMVQWLREGGCDDSSLKRMGCRSIALLFQAYSFIEAFPDAKEGITCESNSPGTFPYEGELVEDRHVSSFLGSLFLRSPSEFLTAKPITAARYFGVDLTDEFVAQFIKVRSAIFLGLDFTVILKKHLESCPFFAVPCSDREFIIDDALQFAIQCADLVFRSRRDGMKFDEEAVFADIEKRHQEIRDQKYYTLKFKEYYYSRLAELEINSAQVPQAPLRFTCPERNISPLLCLNSLELIALMMVKELRWFGFTEADTRVLDFDMLINVFKLSKLSEANQASLKAQYDKATLNWNEYGRKIEKEAQALIQCTQVVQRELKKALDQGFHHFAAMMPENLSNWEEIASDESSRSIVTKIFDDEKLSLLEEVDWRALLQRESFASPLVPSLFCNAFDSPSQDHEKDEEIGELFAALLYKHCETYTNISLPDLLQVLSLYLLQLGIEEARRNVIKESCIAKFKRLEAQRERGEREANECVLETLFREMIVEVARRSSRLTQLHFIKEIKRLKFPTSFVRRAGFDFFKGVFSLTSLSKEQLQLLKLCFNEVFNVAETVIEVAATDIDEFIQKMGGILAEEEKAQISNMVLLVEPELSVSYIYTSLKKHGLTKEDIEAYEKTTLLADLGLDKIREDLKEEILKELELAIKIDKNPAAAIMATHNPSYCNRVARICPAWTGGHMVSFFEAHGLCQTAIKRLSFERACMLLNTTFQEVTGEAGDEMRVAFLNAAIATKAKQIDNSKPHIGYIVNHIQFTTVEEALLYCYTHEVTEDFHEVIIEEGKSPRVSKKVCSVTSKLPLFSPRKEARSYQIALFAELKAQESLNRSPRTFVRTLPAMARFISQVNVFDDDDLAFMLEHYNKAKMAIESKGEFGRKGRSKDEDFKTYGKSIALQVAGLNCWSPPNIKNVPLHFNTIVHDGDRIDDFETDAQLDAAREGFNEELKLLIAESPFIARVYETQKKSGSFDADVILVTKGAKAAADAAAAALIAECEREQADRKAAKEAAKALGKTGSGKRGKGKKGQANKGRKTSDAQVSKAQKSTPKQGVETEEQKDLVKVDLQKMQRQKKAAEDRLKALAEKKREKKRAKRLRAKLLKQEQQAAALAQINHKRDKGDEVVTRMEALLEAKALQKASEERTARICRQSNQKKIEAERAAREKFDEEVARLREETMHRLQEEKAAAEEEARKAIVAERKRLSEERELIHRKAEIKQQMLAFVPTVIEKIEGASYAIKGQIDQAVRARIAELKNVRANWQNVVNSLVAEEKAKIIKRKK